MVRKCKDCPHCHLDKPAGFSVDPEDDFYYCDKYDAYTYCADLMCRTEDYEDPDDPDDDLFSYDNIGLRG